ncbi:MAG: hypothetical protein Q7R45_08255 [Sulfuricaulis sp.]|nr:hypothetical protein [Sulfuricaulis sp.]
MSFDDKFNRRFLDAMDTLRGVSLLALVSEPIPAPEPAPLSEREEIMLAALTEISESFLGDCPAAQDELAHAKAHIHRLRNRAHAAIARAEGRAP